MDFLSELYETHPTTMWVLEKLLSSAVVFLVFFLFRSCWRSARANQKMALADVYDYSRSGSERRGLLLPVVASGHNGRGGGGGGGGGGRCGY